MNGERGRRTRESTLSQFGVASRESSFEGDKERKGSGRIRGYEGKEKERHEASARQQMVKSKPEFTEWSESRRKSRVSDSTDALPSHCTWRAEIG